LPFALRPSFHVSRSAASIAFNLVPFSLHFPPFTTPRPFRPSQYLCFGSPLSWLKPAVNYLSDELVSSMLMIGWHLSKGRPRPDPNGPLNGIRRQPDRDATLIVPTSCFPARPAFAVRDLGREVWIAATIFEVSVHLVLCYSFYHHFRAVSSLPPTDAVRKHKIYFRGSFQFSIVTL